MLDLLGFDRYTIVPVLALCSFKKCLLYHTSNIWLLLRSKVVSGKWMDGLEGEICLKRWLRGKMRALVLHFSQIRDVFSWILQIHCMKVHKHFLFTHRITEGFFFFCAVQKGSRQGVAGQRRAFCSHSAFGKCSDSSSVWRRTEILCWKVWRSAGHCSPFCRHSICTCAEWA